MWRPNEFLDTCILAPFFATFKYTLFSIESKTFKLVELKMIPTLNFCNF